MSKIEDLPNHSTKFLLAMPVAPQYEHYQECLSPPIGITQGAWVETLAARNRVRSNAWAYYSRLIYEVYFPQSLAMTDPAYKRLVTAIAGRKGLHHEQD